MMRLSLAQVLLSALVLHGASLAAALYSKGDGVVTLDDSNFDSLVTNSDGIAVVEFYAPWCGHCQALAPQFKKVAKNLEGLALVGAVDCNEQKNSRLCSRFGIQAFPTIKLFGSDRTKNPYTGEIGKTPEDFNGPRTAKPIADAATALLSDVHIARLASKADLEELAGKAGERPRVLLFTNKDASTTLYKALSTQLHRGLAFAEVHERASELVQQFGVESFPTLVVVKPDGSAPEQYDGELKAPALLRYLAAFSTAPPPGSGGSSGSSDGGSKGDKAGGSGGAEAWAFVHEVTDVAEVLSLESREEMALLAFFGAAGDGCKDARAQFLAAAGEMQAVVDTAVVALGGAEAAAKVAHMGVDAAALEAAPCSVQVVLLPFGEDKQELDDYKTYTGALEGKALQAWVTDAVPLFASRLDDLSAGPFLAMDPSGGKLKMAPKVLLFTNKDEAPGVFRALAMRLRGRGNMAFAWIQANSPGTKTTVSHFQPQKVPALLIALPTVMDPNDPEGSLRFAIQPYTGALKFTPMMAFLEQFAQMIEASAGVVDQDLAARVLPQVRSQSDLEANCTSKPGLCLLALMDPAQPRHEDEVKELLSLAAAQASEEGGAFHFAWLDARPQRAMLRAFGVLSSDVPTLVALSAKRMRYAAMSSWAGLAGATDEEDGGGGSGRPLRLRTTVVAKFVDAVLGGRARTEPMAALPKFSEDGSGGDNEDVGSGAGAGAGGGDGGAGAGVGAEDAGPVEDEFDLSDILSEEVEGSAGGGKADRLREVEEQLKAEAEAKRVAAEEAEAAAKKKSSKKKNKKKKKKDGSKEEL